MPKAGRPTKYTNEFPEKARKLAAKGLRECMIAKKLGIHQDTLIEYKKQFPEFSEAIKIGREESIGEAENSLFKRVTGFNYKEKREEIKEQGLKYNDEGEAILTQVEKKTIITTKKVLPDTGAIAFFLKNKDPQNWKDKQDLSIEDGARIIVSLKNMKEE